MHVTEMIVNAVVCIVVIGSMVLILSKFFKRLNQIEVERWGEKSKTQNEESMLGALKSLIFPKKKK